MYVGLTSLGCQCNVSVVSTGTWKIITRFKDTPQSNFSCDFEVKDYGEFCFMLINMFITCVQ